VPNVPVMFWSFRIMAGIGLLMIALFATAFVLVHPAQARHPKWFLRIAVAGHPAAVDLHRVGLGPGRGRTPALVGGRRAADLPGASSLTVPQLRPASSVFTLLYGALAVVEVGLILHAIKKGPFAEQERSFPSRTPDARPPRPKPPDPA
jgi:cytochrome d ubiquinol oxidase subunit I